jgi:hypothetical protein
MKIIIHQSCQASAFEEVVEWCTKEIKRIKKAEIRANEDIGAWSQIRALSRAKKVFQLRIVKIREELSIK